MGSVWAAAGEGRRVAGGVPRTAGMNAGLGLEAGFGSKAGFVSVLTGGGAAQVLVSYSFSIFRA